MEEHKGEPETINVWELMVDLPDSEGEDGGMAMRSPLVFSTNGGASLRNSHVVESPIFEPPDERQLYVSAFRSATHHQSRSMASVPHAEVRRTSDAYSTCDESTASSSVLFGDEFNLSSFENLVDDLQRSLSLRFASRSEEGKRAGSGSCLVNDKQKKSTSSSGDSAASKLSTETVTTAVSSSSNPSISSSSPTGFKKWFRANYRTLKQKNHLKAGFKSLFGERQSEKHQGATSRLSTGATSESGPDSEEEEDTNSADTYNLERPLAAPASCVRGTESFGGRNRHSFSQAGSRKEESGTQGSGNNKASSWELEKDRASTTRVVLYCTSERSTDVDAYEDGLAVKAILTSLVSRTSFDVRSISEHPEYELELKNGLNVAKVVVPALCVAGKHFVGIDNIMQVYKKGILGSLLLEALPHAMNHEALCTCRAGKFLICPLCKGRCKLSRKDQEAAVTCRHCSGTGLLKCPNCLYS